MTASFPLSILGVADTPAGGSDEVVDSYGTTHRVYQENQGLSSYEVFYKKQVGGQWSSPVQISTSDGLDSTYPRVVVESNFNIVFVTWLDPSAEGYDYVTVVTPSNGSDWYSPEVLGHSDTADPNWDLTFSDQDDILSAVDGSSVTLWLQQMDPEFYNRAFFVEMPRYTFDVRQGEPVLPGDRSIGGYPPGEDGYWIVAVNGRNTVEARELIETTGAEILEFIPRASYLVRMTTQERDSLATLSVVKWVGIFQPAYKVLNIVETIGSQDVMFVDLHKGESTSAASAAIQAFGATVEFAYTDYYADPGGWGHLTINRGPATVSMIAGIRGIKLLDKWSQETFANNVATSVVQDPAGAARTLHAQGLDGFSQVIAFMDSGIDPGHEGFGAPGKILANLNANIYQGGCGDQVDGYGHGTHVGGTLAGDAPGHNVYSDANGPRRDGHAFRARLIVQDIGTNQWFLCPIWNGGIFIPRWPGEAINDAAARGANVHSNSWGMNANLDQGLSRTWDIDMAAYTQNYMPVVFAAGNEGPGPDTLRLEARAKNVITVGADQNLGAWPNQPPLCGGAASRPDCMAAFSSRGPGFNERLKPTIIAPGQGVCSARTAGFGQGGQCVGGNNLYAWADGTSFATPAIAGELALVRQYFTEGRYPTGANVWGDEVTPSSALLRAMTVASGVEMPDPGAHANLYRGWQYPTADQGWGRAVFDNALSFANEVNGPDLLVADERTGGMITGDQSYYRFTVDANMLGDLRIVLVFNDIPAAFGAAAVNNLNLEVMAPNGIIYKGNCFPAFPAAATSIGAACNAEAVNNEEVVFLPRNAGNVAAGSWVVRVMGSNVPGPPQAYALVITGPVKDLIGKQVSHSRGNMDTSSLETGGAGVASLFANNIPYPDLLVMGIDHPAAGTDNFFYRFAWDVDFTGARRTSLSNVVNLASVDANANRDATGGGVACAQLDGAGSPLDCIFMAVMYDAGGEDYFNYFVGWNIQTDGTFATLMDGSQEMFKAGGDVTHGGGVAIGNIGGGTEPDVIFMMIDNGVGNPSPDNYRYKICWDFKKDVAGGLNRGLCNGGKDVNARGGWNVGSNTVSGGDLVIMDIDGQGDGLDVMFGVINEINARNDVIQFKVGFDLIGNGAQKGDFTTVPQGLARFGKTVPSWTSTGLGMATIQLDSGPPEIVFDVLDNRWGPNIHHFTIGYNVHATGWFV